MNGFEEFIECNTADIEVGGVLTEEMVREFIADLWEGKYRGDKVIADLDAEIGKLKVLVSQLQRENDVWKAENKILSDERRKGR